MLIRQEVRDGVDVLCARDPVGEQEAEGLGSVMPRIDVPHDASGPAQARAAVTECADRLGLDELSDDVALVVSEMVTNAVRHAAPPVSVEVEAAADSVVIAVHDGSPSRPTRREIDEDAEGGRGMLLVDLLTDEHGVRSQPPGKTVWARLRRGCGNGS